MILKAPFGVLFSLFFIANSIVNVTYSYFDLKTKAELQKNLATETPQWIIDQISCDLTDALPIKPELIDKTFNEYKGYIIRYTIVDGELSVKFNSACWYSHPTALLMTYFLKELKNYVELPNVDFLIVLDDDVKTELCFVPVMGFCRTVNDKNVLLIPDYQIFHTFQLKRSLSGVDYNILSKVYEANWLYPWDQKIPRAIWRGSCNGGIYTPDNYGTIPRVLLADLALKFPDILDAKFTDSSPLCDASFQVYVGRGMSLEEHIKYKYQILMDGNTCSWPGAFWRFHSNCVVLKQDSDYIQWYYSLLKPYVNYIPLAYNVQDLPQKIQWAQNNDEKLQLMVRNANDMCANCLTYADILYYFYVAINSYAKLQNSLT